MSAQRSTLVVLVVTGGVALGWHDASPAAPARSGTTAHAAVAHAAAAVCDSLRKVDTLAQLEHAVRMGATRVVTDRPEVIGRVDGCLGA